MFHACVQRFDVIGNLKILAKFLASAQVSLKENEPNAFKTRGI
jgi:hypothetical protein